jgi:uncharacterized protein with gpF-like domain
MKYPYPSIALLFLVYAAEQASCFNIVLFPHQALLSILSTRRRTQTQPLPQLKSPPTTLFNAMERLHDSSTNAFGSLEHMYTLNDIDDITQKIADDEWTALGSAIAETMLETILDVCDEVIKKMGWVERMSVTNKIAEDIASTVEVRRWVPA